MGSLFRVHDKNCRHCPATYWCLSSPAPTPVGVTGAARRATTQQDRNILATRRKRAPPEISTGRPGGDPGPRDLEPGRVMRKKRALKYVLGGTAGAAFVTLFGSTAALAQGDDVQGAIDAVKGSTNMLWVVIGAVLVIFMQAGFALVETGFCRARHAAHVVSTNFAVFGLGFIAFFLVGFSFSLERVRCPAILRYRSGRARRHQPARQRQLGVPVEGRLGVVWWRHHAGPARLLPVHGRLHGHHGNDPDGGDGREVEVGQLRDLGLVLWRHLLPAVRRRGPGVGAGWPGPGTR